MPTIIDAITTVLTNNVSGLTSLEIYNKIVEANLYTFKAVSPQSIVNSTIRRHCYGLNFPTASPSKYFKIVDFTKGKTKYILFDQTSGETEIIPVKTNKKERTVEEIINDAHYEHIESTKSQLMNAILNSSPSFFESLVVQLLVKMGYGCDDNSGKVTRYCKDGGIDGIIEEDRLGFDKIYIQAKRYAIENKVDTVTVDQFAAAMGKRNAKKGVFITTSSFVKNARDEYSKPVEGKTIRLIEGEELMNYLLRYEIGVKNVMTYTTYKLDENYFSPL